MVVRTHRHILCLREPICVKDNIHEEEENVTKGRKRKGTSSPKACESASFGRPWVDQWISLQASSLVQVAEVVQGVEDGLPLRGTSAVVVLVPQKIR